MTGSVLEIMQETKKGYRTENFSGSRVRLLSEVIEFELSMGNTDIISYVQDNYEILKDYQLDTFELERVRKEYPHEDDYNTIYWEMFSDMCIDNSTSISEEIVDYFKEIFSVEDEKDMTALWLTSHENVINYYNDGNTEDIDEYTLPNKDKFSILSDLGVDGVLFLFLSCDIINSI